MIVFRQSGDHSDSGCTRAKVVVIGQNVVVLGQKGLYSGKVVVFWQIRLFSDKKGGFSGKVLVFSKNS